MVVRATANHGSQGEAYEYRVDGSAPPWLGGHLCCDHAVGQRACSGRDAIAATLIGRAGRSEGGPGQGGGGRRSTEAPATPAVAEQHKLPPDSTTKQTVDLPGRSLSFTATAGSIRLFDDKGEPQADIAYTSYQLDGADRATRPVTFLFNGGPGAASAYLQLGNNGPWRLAINADAVTPSASPDLQPNAETWLDFTDLVYIDPVGTGYSRFVATGEDVRKRFYSVDGDVAEVAVVIRRWLEKHDRLLSPKYVAGESYGGIRGPKVVRNLQTRSGHRREGADPDLAGARLPRIHRLEHPAICREPADLCGGRARGQSAGRQGKRQTVTRADLADVEKYASGDFLSDLIKGEADQEATNRIADKVAASDRHRPGRQPQACGALRRDRIPQGVRPPQRPRHRPLRCVGVGAGSRFPIPAS